MSVPLDLELLNCFLDEAVDTLGRWERACLDLENSESVEVYNELFRAAHNLKGASRSVGLEGFGAFVHIAEDVINLLIKGELVLYPGLISILLESQVFLNSWVDGLRQDPEFAPEDDLLKRKIELLGKREPAMDHFHHPASVSKTSSSSEQPTPVASLPVKQSDVDELEAIFKAAQIQFGTAPQEPTPQAKVVAPAPPASKSAEKPTPEATKASGEGARVATKQDETVRVAASKLDELIQLIGELTIHQSIIFQGRRSGNLHQPFYQNAIQLSHKITKELHTKALSLRMQPVQSLFQRLERVAKDVARAQGKKINVQLDGTEVELDKSVIEHITDPLVHILRNAVDHGIEMPGGRTETGKQDTATVGISAYQDAGSVCIKITDDGRGLNSAKILKKAIDNALIAADAKLSTKEIQNLIFLPGFSTADKVTDISGRGVGMDVALRGVQALQGSIDVSSTEGQGTTFAITLPSTMSIVDGLVVKVNSLRYVVSMHELTEIIDLSDYEIESTGNCGKMLSLRGGVIPLEPLNRYVETVTTQKQDEAASQLKSKPALVVKDGTTMIAFQIDEVLGQQSVVVRPLNEQMSKLGGFTGSTILGDGEPGMILSLTELARDYFQHSRIGAH